MPGLSSNKLILSIPVKFIEKIGCAVRLVAVWIDTSCAHSLLQSTALQAVSTWLANSGERKLQTCFFQRIFLFDEIKYLFSIALEHWIGLCCSIPVGTIGGLVRIVLLVWLTTSKDGGPALFVVAVSRSYKIECKNMRSASCMNERYRIATQRRDVEARQPLTLSLVLVV